MDSQDRERDGDGDVTKRKGSRKIDEGKEQR
jgi:hypothetical protein